MNINLIGISGKIGSGKDEVGRIIRRLTDPAHPAVSAMSPWKIVKYTDKLKDVVCLLLGCTREQLEDREFKNTPLGSEWNRFETYFVENDKTLMLHDTLEEAKAFWNTVSGDIEVKYRERQLTPRLILQLMGTEAGRNIIHPNIWVNATFADYKFIKGKYLRHDTHKEFDDNGKLLREQLVPVFEQVFPNWIITDVRFPNEAEAIRQRGGKLIRLERDTELRYPNLWEDFHKSEYDAWDDFLKNTGMLESVYHGSEISLDKYPHWDHVIHNNGSLEDLETNVKLILDKYVQQNNL